MRKAYQTDLSNAEWDCIQPYLPTPKPGGRPRVHTLREILDAVFFTPCAPAAPGACSRTTSRLGRPSITTSGSGAWTAPGSECTPPYASACACASGEIPSPAPASSTARQSVKTTGVGGQERGYDGGKQIKGRKRHLLVDTEGLLMKAKVHGADVSDRDGIKPLLERAKELFPRMKHPWLDAGYNGKGKGKDWAEKVLGWTGEIVKRPRRWVRVPKDQEPPPYPKGFIVLPRRWVVERTISWICQNRRMSKDYERVPQTGEAFMYVVMSRLMVRRLARQ